MQMQTQRPQILYLGSALYRLPAHADTFNTSINYRINSNHKMDIGMQYAKINAEGNQQYDATQVHLSWLHRFKLR